MDRTTTVLTEIGRAAHANGLTAYAVGGCVRDRVLGRKTKDLDILVLEPEGGIRLAGILRESYGFGRPVVFPRFGTAQTRRNGIDVELVATRKEAYEAASRKPSVKAASLTEDIARRDFTVNTLVMRLLPGGPGPVEDVTGQGLPDMEARIIRTVGDAAERFDEDPLRMLRAVRFACQLGFGIEEAVTRAATRMHARLAIISRERIREELRKVLVSSEPARGMRWLERTGLLAEIDPALAGMAGFDQNNPFHTEDLFSHTLSVLDRTKKKLTVRLAALYHDAGKVTTRQEKDGRSVYYKHEHESARIARNSLKALTFPNRVVDDACALIRLHMVNYSSAWSGAAVRRFIHRAGPYLADLQNLRRADMRALAPPHDRSPEITEFDRRIRSQNAPAVRGTRCPVDGNRIQDLLGIGPGKKIAEVKARVLDAILEGEIPDTVPEVEALILREFRKDEHSTLNVQRPTSNGPDH